MRNIQGYIPYKFVLIALLFILSCKTSQPTSSTQANQFFTVSLYSPGSGIDHEAHNIVVNTIQKFKNKGLKIDYDEVRWGKEGEIDYCFNLQTLSPQDYHQFHDELTGLLKGRMVNILEQKPCRNPH